MFDSKLNSLLVLSVTNSITQTAKIVNLTQPSVTAQIRALEEEYGIKIIKKVGNDLIITPEGRILIKHADNIKAAYLGADKELKNYKTKNRTLKIGLTSGIESTHVSVVLAKLSQQMKQQDDKFNIQLIYDTSKRLIEMLRFYEIDLLITDDVVHNADVKKTCISRDQLVFVTSPRSKSAGFKQITLMELKKANLVIRLPNSSTQILFDALLRTHNMSINDFNIMMELNSVSAIKSLVKNDFSGAILAQSACQSEVEKGELVVIPIKEVTTSHDTNLIYLNDFSRPEIINKITTLYADYGE